MMKFLVPQIALVAFACAGCNAQVGSSTPPPGSVPAVRAPVGPIPGPTIANRPVAPNPYAGNAVAATEGRRLFVAMNCYGCHGGHGGGGMGPSLRDPDWRFGQADEQIFDSIAHGRGHGMPAWGTRLPEDQIWKLVAYIQALGTAGEPQPPQ